MSKSGPYLRIWTKDVLGDPAWSILSPECRCAWISMRIMGFHLGVVGIEPDRVLLAIGYSEAETAELLAEMADKGVVPLEGVDADIQEWQSFRESKVKAARARWDAPAHAPAYTKGDAKRMPAPAPALKEPQSPSGSSVLNPSSEPKGSSEGTRNKTSRSRKPATGPQAEAMRLWEGLWEDTRGCSWVWDTKHAVGISRALKKAGGSLEEFEGRARRLLVEPPDRWMAQNASPAILDSRWNELAVTIATVKTDQERRQDAIQERLRRMAEGGGEPESRRNGRLHPGRPALLEP